MSQASAYLLFIDMNNADLEIKVAREAAAKRGEELIVLPKNRDELRKLNSHLEENTPLVSQMAREHCSALYTSSCRSLDKKIQDNNKKAGRDYNGEQLAKELRDLPTGMASVMISGHDGNGNFSGAFGYMKIEDFLKSFENFKQTKDIKSVYLLGCNSATAEVIGESWLRAFPKANFIGGYEETGYLRDNTLGHQYIKNVLAEEPKLLAARSINEAQSRMRKLFNGDAVHSVSACIQKTSDPKDAQFISSWKKSGKLSEILKCPGLNANEVSNLIKCFEDDVKSCALQDVSKIKVKMAKAECDFALGPNYSKDASKLYFLQSLIDPANELNYKNILEKLPDDLKKKYKAGEDIKTYAELKDKFLNIKNEFERRSDFDSLKSMSVKDLENHAFQKKYFDTAWLAFSNLDVAAAATMISEYRGHQEDYNSGVLGSDQEIEQMAGVLRAESYHLKLSQPGSALTYESRQKEVRAEVDQVKSKQPVDMPTLETLSQELMELKQFQSISNHR